MAFNPLIERIRTLNKKIRIFCEDQSIYNYKISNMPLGGSIKDSIGPWPEYIVHGIKCRRSEAGFCSPCGYSHDGYSRRKLDNLEIDVENYLYNQLIVLVKNFRKMVSERQFCNVQGDRKVYIAFTALGSFFCDEEMNFKSKLKVLKQVQGLIKKEKTKICFVTEVHVKDVINYEKSGKLNRLSDILTSLNTVVILGFESINDFIRNYLYCKGLTIHDFEYAVHILKKHNIYPAAFVFVGTHTLSQMEIINDFEKSVQYLYNLSVIPVVMVANLKIGTLDHLLFTLSNQKLVEPRTVERVLCTLKRNEKSLFPFPWLIADPVGGPPEPLVHSFNNDKMWTCKDCSYNILAALRYLRKTYDWRNYETILSPEVRECTCQDDYEQQVDLESNVSKPIEVRLERNIKTAEENLHRYFDFLVDFKNKHYEKR